jgi:cytochrome P450
MRFAFSPAAVWTIIDSARNWRIARDAGDPVQPSLYRRLERFGAGLLAPVFDSVMSLFEAGFRRHFRAGNLLDIGFSRDEHHLVALLEGTDATAFELFDPSLAGAMRVALHSARIMLLSVIGEVIGVPSAPASTPLFFPAVATQRAPLSNGIHVYFKQ